MPLLIPLSELALGADLGEGSYGSVQRATWRGMLVAVKSLQGEEAGEAARSFEREMRTLGALHHPNIVTFHGIVQLSEGRMGLVEELAEGGALLALLCPGAARLPSERVVSIALDIARALAYAHSRGVTHCDLKSANVVLTASGVAKLCDFGLASRVRAALPSTGTAILSSIGGDGGVLGTLGWTAPENFAQGTVGYGQTPADVYSLGCVMYEMASGLQPWPEGRMNDIIVAVLGGERPGRPERVEERLWTLIERCWAGVASQRPSAAEVVGELEGWQREAAALSAARAAAEAAARAAARAAAEAAARAAARGAVAVGGGRLAVGTLVKAAAGADESDILGRAGSGLRGRVVKDDLSEKPYKVQLVDGSDFDCEWG